MKQAVARTARRLNGLLGRRPAAPRRAPAVPPFKRRVLFEALEPRLLLSADVLPAAAPAVMQLHTAGAVAIDGIAPLADPVALSLTPIGAFEGGARLAEPVTVSIPLADGGNDSPYDYTVDLAAGQAISIAARTTAGGGVFDVELLDPSGNSVWDDGGDGTDFALGQNIIAGAAGTYTVRLVAQPAESAWSARLDIAVDAVFEAESLGDGSDANGTTPESLDGRLRPLPLPPAARTTVVGTLVTDGSSDRYSIDLAAGDVFAFEFTLGRDRGAARLLHADGTLVATAESTGAFGDDEGPQGLRAVAIDTAGTYIVELRSYAADPTQTLDYTLLVGRNVSLDPDLDDDLGRAPSQLGYVPPPPPSASSVQTLSSQFGNAAFDAVAVGGTITIDVVPVADASLGDAATSFVVQVDADGTQLALTEVAPPAGQGGRRWTATAAAGTALTIGVFAQDGAGQFQLRAAGVAPADASGPAPVFSSFDDNLVGSYATFQYIYFDAVLRADRPGSFELRDAENALVATVTATGADFDSHYAFMSLPDGLAAGTYRLVAAAGALVDAAGEPSSAFDYEFVVDDVRPTLVSTSLADGAELPANGSVTLRFDEPMRDYLYPYVYDADGTERVVPIQTAWSGDHTVLTVTIGGALPEGDYRLVLYSVADRADNEVDRNPETPYAEPIEITFTTDAASYPLPAFAAEPSGALVYTTSRAATLSSAADTDLFTFDADAGSTFSVAVTSGGPRLSLTLVDPAGDDVQTVTATDAGRGLLLADVAASAGGVWSVRVESADGSLGDYAVAVVRGAAIEGEGLDADGGALPADDTRATAVDLDGASIALGAGIDRVAAVGRFDGAAQTDWYRLTLAAGASTSIVLALHEGADVADLRLSLYGADGDLAASNGSLIGSAVATGNVDRAMLDYTNTSGAEQTLYVRAAAGGTATYTLLATRGATFDIGPLDQEPQWLGPTGTVLGATGSGGTAGGDVGLPTAQTVGFPLRLFDGDGYLWDIQQNGVISDGTNDAYDNAHYVNVSGAGGYGSAGFSSQASATDLDGREVVLVGTPLSDLQVVRKIYVPDDAGFARFLESFTNTGSATREFTVELRSNLGSDGGTVLVATASGDGGYDADEQWVLTDDVDSGGDPSLAHVVWGDGGLPPSAASLVSDNLSQSWTLTIAPGETVSLLHFAVQAQNRATARATVDTLIALDDAALEGLTTQERNSVVNFGGLAADSYRFWATSGDALSLAVQSAPGAPALPFRLQLLAPDGSLVLDTGEQPAPISGLSTGITAGQTGAYVVRLLAEDGKGEYLLGVNGMTGRAPTPQVVRATPADGLRVPGMPESLDLVFDGFLRADSVDANDLALDAATLAAGGGVSSVEMLDGRTLRFHLRPVAGDRVVAWTIDAGALTGFDGQGNTAASGSFDVDATGPRVLTATPNATVAPLVSVAFDFSEAVDPASVSIADLVFTGPDGTDLRGSVTTIETDGTRVVVNFQAQYASGDYVLTLGPQVRDLAGNPMDQDADGTPGEAADAYTTTIALSQYDLHPTAVSAPASLVLGQPVQVSWTVENAGDVQLGDRGWYDAVQLVRTSDGAVVSNTLAYHFQSASQPLLPGGRYDAGIAITPPIDPSISEGDYVFRVVVDYYNNVPEGREQNNQLASGTVAVTAPAVPNLVAGGVTAPADAAGNTRITVGWTITNSGAAATQSGAYDRVELVNAAGGVAQYLDVYNPALLAPGQAQDRSAEIVLRNDLVAGNYTVRVRADAYNYVREYAGENDNLSAAVPIVLAAPRLPDLSNVRQTTPLPADATVGAALTLNYRVDNAGPGGTENIGWTDRVVLVSAANPDTVLRAWYFGAGGGTGLPAGADYNRSVDVTLPLNGTIASGDYVFRVDVDYNNALREAVEGNQRLEVPIHLTVPPIGNLVVTGISAPANAFAGTDIDVTWTDANTGDGDLRYYGGAVFYDTVYLQSAQGGLTYLADFGYTTNIAAGASVERTQRVRLPENLLAGDYRLVVVVDNYNYVNENGSDNDNRGTAAAVTAIAQPPRVDLQVPTVTVPATGTTGSPLHIDWQTRNGGAADFGGSFTDRIQFSRSSNFSSNVRDVADIVYTGTIAAGQTVARSADVALPIDLDGTWYVRVVSDILNQVYEYQLEDNNIGVAPSTVVLTVPPLADLVVSDIQAPTAATAGSTVTVSYTVANNGTAAAGARTDRIYLSGESGTLYTIQLDNAVDAPLAVGASETRQVQFTLPLNYGSTEYVGALRAVVDTDIGNTVLEYPHDDNNRRVDDTAITVTLPPLPDLRVTDIVAPQQALTAAEIPVRWTVVNEGTAAFTGGWTDNIWLSSDATIDNGDRYLGSFAIDATLAAGASIERVQNLTLPIDLTGPYRILIRTDVGNRRFEGTAGEADNDAADDTTLTILQRPIPNLVVTAVVPPTDAFSGQQASVGWTVKNIGNGSTSTPVWYDRVYLSQDGTLSGDDVYLAQVVNPGYLDVNDEYANSAAFTLPQGIDGSYSFIVVTDVFNQVYEGTAAAPAEDDNVLASAATRVRLTPPPDLKVTDIGAPPQAFSGQPVTISWTVLNDTVAPDGGRTRTAQWVDRIWMSADATLDGGDRYLGDVVHNGALDPQESYVGSLDAVLPIGVTGSFRFIVQTDLYNQVYEHTAEGNNTTADTTPTEVLLTPPPDLEIVSQTHAATARAGTVFTVAYRVENLGATATPDAQSYWYDQAWLSLDNVIDGSDIALGGYTHYGVLDVDEGYDGTLSVVLPQAANGTYNLLLRTDAGNQVFETDNANNTLAAGTVTVFQSRPDLVVSAFTAPATAEAGRSATFSWTVANSGSGDTIAERWSDSLWGSVDNQIGNNDDFLVADVDHQGVLAPNGSYDVSVAPVLPFSIEGTTRFYLRTDGGNAVFEGNEGNNVSVAATTDVLREEPDLRIGDATLTAVDGEPRTFDLHYVVRNAGTNATNVNYWYDGVWISADATIGAGDTRIATPRRTNPLAPGEQYAVDVRVVVPSGVPAGDYKVLVRADDDNVVIEGGGEGDNNVAVAAVVLPGGGTGTTLPIAPLPVLRPDLVVTAVDAPDAAFSGQRVTIAWTTRNQGDAAGTSYDQVYLSADAFLDSGDISLGYGAYVPLAGGAERQGSLTATLPIGRSGPYYVLVKADAGGQVAEPDAEGNNVGYDPALLQITLAPPADLVAGTIVLPANAVPGQSMAVTYTVNNASGNDAVGAWRDTLYLSQDDVLDAGDVVFGGVDVYGPVDAGTSYTRTVDGVVPGVDPGSYRLIVRSDVRNVLPEASESNNIGASLDSVALDVQALAVGVPVNGTFEAGQAVYYKVVVGAGEALRFTLDGPGTDVAHEVFVRYGAMPTRSNNDANTGEQFTPDPVVTVPGTEAGTYYVRIDASPFQGGAYTLTATLVPFSVERVAAQTIGNTGEATLRIDGARFDASTTFDLVAEDGTVYRSVEVSLADAGRAYATFDLFGADPGRYDIRAHRDTGGAGGTLDAELLDAVSVIDGEGADAFITIQGPTAVQVNRDATFYLNYSNDGDADTMAPLLIVTPSAGTTVGFSAKSLGAAPLFILGAGLDGPADLLRPGAKHTVSVAYHAPGETGYLSVEARPVQSDSTERVADWSAIERSVRPAGIDNAVWTRFWGRVQPAIGATYGNLVQVLNDMVVRLSPAGNPIRDVRALFAAQIAADPDWMPSQQVSGVLRASADGATVAGVEVQLLQRREDGGYRVVARGVTDSDGTFAIAGVRAGAYVLALTSGTLDMDRDGTSDATPPPVTIADDAAPAPLALYTLPATAEAPVVREDSDPQLIVDTAGTVHMFFQRGDLYYHAVRVDGAWTGAQPISEATGTNLSVTAGATLVGGQPGLVAVWEQGEGNDTQIFASVGVRDDAGGFKWSKPVQVTDTAVASYSPAVEIDADGNAFLVFQRRDFDTQDDADLYAFEMVIDPAALDFGAAAAATTSSSGGNALDSSGAAAVAPAAVGTLEPQAGQVSVGYSHEFGPYDFLGFSFRTGIEGTAVATLDEAACQTTAGLNAKGSISIRIPGLGRGTGEGSARGSAVWSVDPSSQDWKLGGAQMDIGASVKLEVKDGLFKLLGVVPALAPVSTGLRAAMNAVTRWTGGAIKLENAITPAVNFEAKDLRWTTQAPFPSFLWPDSVGEMALGGEIGLSAKGVLKGWDSTEISLEGKVGFKATIYPSLSNPQITYAASLSAKVMGWVLFNGEWSGSTALGSSSLDVLADGAIGPEDGDDLIFVWDPTKVIGTTNVYGTGAVDAQVATNRANDSPMRLTRAGDGTVVGVFARDGDILGGEIGNRIMVTEHGTAGWTDEVAIPDTLGFNGEAVVTVLPNGSRMVVYSHASAAGLTTTSAFSAVTEARKNSDIYYAIDNGSGYGTPVLLGSRPGSDTDLAIAKGADGSMQLAWINATANEQVLYTAGWNGTSFTAPVEVARTSGALENVTIAISQGQVLLAWNLDADKADDNNLMQLMTATVAGTTVSAGEFETSAVSAEYERVLMPPPAVAATAAQGGWFGTEAGWPPFAVPEDCKKCTPEKLKKITEAAPDCRPGGGSETTVDAKKCEQKTVTYAPCVTRPRDPNDIIGPDSFGPEGWVAAGETLQYTIRFENAADATAPAQVVTVTQTLDEDLDARTFRIDDFGFGDVRSEEPANAAFLSKRLDLRESQGIYVDVSARIDVATRVVTWIFTTIDPETGEVPVDATKGFLLPDDDTGRGDGFISYTVRAKRTATTGTRIDAQARIVFDAEGPIDTPPIFNTLDAGKPQSAVKPLPATSDDTRFTVRWAGTDDDGGSALRDYDVYVRVNDGDWTLWQFNTTDTEAVYEGDAGTRYAFYSVARDNAGNVEAAPASADATIQVIGQVGSIAGSVFNDIDADGIRDGDEGALSGWTVFLDADADGVRDDDEVSVITGDDGAYAFADLQPGSYRVALVASSDYEITAPVAGFHTVTLAAGDAVTGRAFGVLPLGSISGVQFDDADGDGVFDDGEQGLEGWTVFIDADSDGVLDSGERSTTTAADGSYRIGGLRAGAYTVATVLPEGWIQTAPAPAGASAGANGAQTAFAVTLSGSLASISLPACACGGTVTSIAAQQAGWDEQLVELDAVRADPVYAGVDGHGIRVVVIDTGIDTNHPFFDGRIVYQHDFADDDNDASDVNGHGTHVAGVIGAQDGLFGGVAPGVELIVLKVFGNDGSGSFRDLERALQWVVANAEAYRIGVVNLSLGDGGTWTDAIGRYGLGDEFAALAAKNIINVAAAGNNYAQTNALGVAYPAADPAVLSIGAVWAGDFGGPWSFGNGGTDTATGADHIASFSQRDDALLDAFAPGARLTSAAIGGGVRTMQGTSQSAAYVSGVAALAQQLAHEHLGRSLSMAEFRELLIASADSINDGDDERDNVANSGLDFPRLNVKALVDRLLAMAPGGGGGAGGGGDDGGGEGTPVPAAGGIAVDVGVGQDVAGVNFGAFRLGTVGGTVFDDRDGDGVQDAGEAGVSGATVFVDTDGDGVLDDGETAVTTDGDGHWSLADLGPGSLALATVLPVGDEATTPQPVTIAITSGTDRDDVDFGRRDRPPVAVDDSATVVEGSTVTGNVLANDSDPGRADNALLSVTLLLPPASGSLTLNADGSFSYTAAAGFAGTVSFGYRISDGVSGDDGLVTITVLHDNLQVRTFTGRHDGFTVQFTRAVAQAGLDTGDLVVTGPGGQAVAGSLFVAADGLSARFIATGRVLADGVYAVRLVAGADALRDTTGIALDGNGDGTVGDDYVGGFTVAKGTAVAVGLADTARGPGQVLGLAPADTGLAIRLSDGSGVTSVSFTVDYDPSLLGTATVVRGANVPAGAGFAAVQTVPGRIAVTITSATAFAAGQVTLGSLVATVPGAAAYGAAEVIDIGNVVVNGGARAALDDDAVHVVAFPGDLNGDRTLSNVDQQALDQLLGGSLARLPWLARIDATLLGDVNGSGGFDAMDSTRLAQYLAGTGNAIVPVPGATPPTPVPPPRPPKPPVKPVTAQSVTPAASWVTPLVSPSATVQANVAIRVSV